MQAVTNDVTSAGVVVFSEDGRVYVRIPTDEFGGYKWSFAKGRLEAALSIEQNALRELREEMGLEARIVGVIGDYKGDTSVTRFFLGEETGGDITRYGSETEEVRLASYEEARKLLNKPRDKQVLEDALRLRRSLPSGS
jgi:8-oxo-dGTP pyrophosphatase MutT (NUDIX family)